MSRRTLLAGGLLLLASSGEVSGRSDAPRLKWIYLASGAGFERWRGDGFVWEGRRDEPGNPPQTLTSITAGGMLGLGPRLGLLISLPFFHNRSEPYVYYGANMRGDAVSGLGDLDIGLAFREGAWRYSTRVAIPGLYDTDGGLYGAWAGFGVYRLLFSAHFSGTGHKVWIQPEAVVHKPGGRVAAIGERAGLVEPGDFEVKAGYAHAFRMGALREGWAWQLRPGVDLSHSSYHWLETYSQFKTRLDPHLSLSLSPRWSRELSLTLGFTLFSRESGDVAVYGSRRIFIGAYFGYYR